MQVNKSNFNKEVKESKGIVLVDFYADWCGPCMMLTPILEELSNKYKDIKICKVNIDEEMELAMEYGVMSIPNVFFFKDGKTVNSFLGFRPLTEIEEIIKKI